MSKSKFIVFDTQWYDNKRLKALENTNIIFVFGENDQDKKKKPNEPRDGSGNQALMLVPEGSKVGFNHSNAHGFITCPKASTSYDQKFDISSLIDNQYGELKTLIDQGKSLHLPVIKDKDTGDIKISLGAGIGGFSSKITQKMNDKSIELANYAISQGYDLYGVAPDSELELNKPIKNVPIPQHVLDEAWIKGKPWRDYKGNQQGASRQNELDQLSPDEKQAKLQGLWDALLHGGMKSEKLEETIEELKKFPEVADNPKADKAFDDARRVVQCKTAQELDAEYREAEKLTRQYIKSGNNAAVLGIAKDATTSLAGAINPFDVKDPEWKKCQILLIIFVGPIWGVLKGVEKITAIGKKEAEKDEKESGGILESKFGFKDLFPKKDAAATAAKVTPEATKPAQPKVSSTDIADKQRKKNAAEAVGGKDPLSL